MSHSIKIRPIYQPTNTFGPIASPTISTVFFNSKKDLKNIFSDTSYFWTFDITDLTTIGLLQA